MNSNRIIFALVALALLIWALIYYSFDRIDVPDVQWEVDYGYENKNPHGGWLLAEVLKEVYGEDRIIKLNEHNAIPSHNDQSRKGYFIISDYLSFEKEKVERLADFVERGNDAIIISSDMGYYFDSLFQDFFTDYSISDSVINLSLINDSINYELSYYCNQFDSASSTYFYAFDSLNIEDHSIDILSNARDSLPIFLKLKYGHGHFYIHSIPDAYSNIGIKQESMNDYLLNSLPLLELDTLFLDHNRYDAYYSLSQSPLQYIMSQPPLKWSYYVAVLGLIVFVISRGKRRQRVIPILEQNENTSLEYVNTLSELYRSQNQHHKLAKHLKSIFTQSMKRKYYLTPESTDYISRIAHKSKIPEEEIERLLGRLNSAAGNRRFDSEQLSNLFLDLSDFYNNCK